MNGFSGCNGIPLQCQNYIEQTADYWTLDVIESKIKATPSAPKIN